MGKDRPIPVILDQAEISPAGQNEDGRKNKRRFYLVPSLVATAGLFLIACGSGGGDTESVQIIPTADIEDIPTAQLDLVLTEAFSMVPTEEPQWVQLSDIPTEEWNAVRGLETPVPDDDGDPDIEKIKAEVGGVAPDFTLDDGFGNTWSMDDFKGDPLVVLFTSPDCDSCNANYSSLFSLSSAYYGQGGQRLVIQSADDLGRIDRYGNALLSVYDEQRVLDGVYVENSWPVFYFIGSDGVIREKITGDMLREDIEATAVRLLD